MKVKKYLERQAEQDRKEILSSDNGEFLRALQQSVQPKAEKRRAKLKVWLPAALSAVAAAVVLVTCTIIYYPSSNKPIEYSDLNFVHNISTVEAMRADFKKFEFQTDSSAYTYTVKKTTDIPTGDTVYYAVTVTSSDLLVQMNIIAVQNPNFKYKLFEFSDQVKSETLANYSILYEGSTETGTEFGIDVFTAKAKITREHEIIYVTEYSEVLLSSQESFFEVLQSFIK